MSCKNNSHCWWFQRRGSSGSIQSKDFAQIMITALILSPAAVVICTLFVHWTNLDMRGKDNLGPARWSPVHIMMHGGLNESPLYLYHITDLCIQEPQPFGWGVHFKHMACSLTFDPERSAKASHTRNFMKRGILLDDGPSMPTHNEVPPKFNCSDVLWFPPFASHPDISFFCRPMSFISRSWS